MRRNEPVSEPSENSVAAPPERRYVAFRENRCIASGTVEEVTRSINSQSSEDFGVPILIFDGVTSERIELDWRGDDDPPQARVTDSNEQKRSSGELMEKRGPGRPKLGVVAREVTLLPRHWAWLNEQPGGASVALRKLVEEARRTRRGIDQARRSQEAYYRFISTVAGDLVGYEEALRAFYSRKYEIVGKWLETCPTDIRNHAQQLLFRVMRDEVDKPQ